MAKPIKPARYLRDVKNPIRAEKKRQREADRTAAKVQRKADKIKEDYADYQNFSR